MHKEKTTVEANPQMTHTLELAHEELKITNMLNGEKDGQNRCKHGEFQQGWNPLFKESKEQVELKNSMSEITSSLYRFHKYSLN